MIKLSRASDNVQFREASEALVAVSLYYSFSQRPMPMRTSTPKQTYHTGLIYFISPCPQVPALDQPCCLLKYLTRKFSDVSIGKSQLARWRFIGKFGPWRSLATCYVLGVGRGEGGGMAWCIYLEDHVDASLYVSYLRIPGGATTHLARVGYQIPYILFRVPLNRAVGALGC